MRIRNALVIAAGGGTWGNPGFWESGIARIPGRMLLVETGVISADTFRVGWDQDRNLAIDIHSFYASGPFYPLMINSNAVNHALTIRAATQYQTYSYAIILRASGAQYFTRTGKSYAWMLEGIMSGGTTSTLYPGISDILASLLVFQIRVPVSLWLAIPVASDGFSAFGATDGLGHAEGVAGGVGSGGVNMAWTQQLGTWSAVGGKAVATALDGVTSMAVATVDAGTPNVHVDSDLVRTAGTAGIVVRYVDADNYVRASHDGTNAMLIKRVAGVDTTVSTVAIAYAANAKMHIIANGTTFQLLYNGIETSMSGLIIADVVLQTSTLCGIRTTDTGNTHDNFVVMAAGNERQYDVLNQYL